MKAKRQYDPEFKREAVRLVVEEGLRVRKVERNRGITHAEFAEFPPNSGDTILNSANLGEG
jgi:hypothetical protein